ALVCAGALELAAGVDLVRFRGKAMQEAVPAGAGAMAAILGLDDSKVAEACAEAALGAVVEPVNFNAPGQVVVAGERSAVERTAEVARRLGAKRAILLSVSVPAHSSLMGPAAARLRERLATLELAVPRIAYVSAVDAERHSDPADIRKVLERQIVSPVRWQDTVRALVSNGHRTLIECGPGKVLTALNRRIARNAECLPLEDSAAIVAALDACRGASERVSREEQAALRGDR
ncbi:MAG: ACP S-malonyltransferase, partial [Steroidobacteraceae bacterium]